MRPVKDFTTARRNLPHGQLPGSVYFVTWRVAAGQELTPADRSTTLDAIRFWDAKRWHVYAAVVMPDHVHLLARPLPIVDTPSLIGHATHDLGELVGSVKKYSARRIDAGRRGDGPVWQDERYDRIVRDGREFEETSHYIRNNPVASGLATQPEGYPWLYEAGTPE